jgi:hypothetical protein
MKGDCCQSNPYYYPMNPNQMHQFTNYYCSTPSWGNYSSCCQDCPQSCSSDCQCGCQSFKSQGCPQSCSSDCQCGCQSNSFHKKIQ